MDDVKIAIPHEIAETIVDYCQSQMNCVYCVLKDGCFGRPATPSSWDLDEMIVEEKGNG